MKLLLVSSSGGHLNHLMRIKKVWDRYDRVWVTFDKPDAVSALENENIYFGYFPTNRNIMNLIRNLFLAIKILFSEKPDVVVSTGAGIAVPFFYVAKLMRIKTVYIEVIDRVDKPTLTGRLVERVTDLFIVQWPEMKSVYKKSMYIGRIY